MSGNKNKTILILAIAAAFVAGTLTTATIVTAEADTIIACVNNKSQGEDLRIVDSAAECRNYETAIEWNVQGPQGPPGSSGSEMPISIGMGETRNVSVNDCPQSAGSLTDTSGGPVVLLSDGTVKALDITGSLVTLDPLFGSLPAGVWHDIDLGFHSIREVPAGCFGAFPADNSEFLSACAVADTGDVFCVNGNVANGALTFGTPWTFIDDVIP